MLLVKANRDFSAWTDVVGVENYICLIKQNDYLLISQEVSNIKGQIFIICYLLSQKIKVYIEYGLFVDYSRWIEGLNPEGSEKFNEFKQRLDRKHHELLFS